RSRDLGVRQRKRAPAGGGSAAALVGAGSRAGRYRRGVRGRVHGDRAAGGPADTCPPWRGVMTSEAGPSVDQQLALRTAAARLAAEYAGVFGTATIERFLSTSYDQFAARSTVPRFLPSPAERFARQRLTALARVEGLTNDRRPTVLFLCVHN